MDAGRLRQRALRYPRPAGRPRRRGPVPGLARHRQLRRLGTPAGVCATGRGRGPRSRLTTSTWRPGRGRPATSRRSRRSPPTSACSTSKNCHIDPDRPLSDAEWEEVRRYNRKDLAATQAALEPIHAGTRGARRPLEPVRSGPAVGPPGGGRPTRPVQGLPRRARP